MSLKKFLRKRTPFDELIEIYMETTGATFQYYFNKTKSEHVIYLTSNFVSFHNPDFYNVIQEAIDYILKYREEKTVSWGRYYELNPFKYDGTSNS